MSSRNLPSKTLLFLIIFASICMTEVLAGETDSAASAQPSIGDDIKTMSPVVVVGKPDQAMTGSSTLDRSDLDRLPAKNGSVNEVISVLPGVQLPEHGRLSTNGGEIVPPDVAISGGKTYQNNFLIDGISNNSLLDPDRDDPTSIMFVPGHPQSSFLNTRLVEDITVYRYNIPAAYGNFTGGVVDVSTLAPQNEFFGDLHYRTTNHNWTQLHFDDDFREEFESSNSAGLQPEFKRQDTGLLLNVPVSSRLRLLGAYQLNHSEIPLRHLNASRTQKRLNENYLFKLSYDVNNDTRLTADLNYAPYEGDYFYPDSYQSDFTIEGGGLQTGLTWEQQLDLGALTLRGAWKSSKNHRDAPNDLRPWLAELKDGTPTSKPWGLELGSTKSFEGSVGSLELDQEGVQLKADLAGKPVDTGPVRHSLNLGIDYEHAHATLQRDEANSQYYVAVQDTTGKFDCSTDVTYCVQDEQYFNRRLYFAADEESATINFLDLYLEDRLAWQRLELRPGVRLSYDDFMENTNLAPRLAASLDIFGDGRTLLIGGYNRYYGRTLLAYKLREGSQPSQQQDLKKDADTDEWVWLDKYLVLKPSAKLPEGFINDYRASAYQYSRLDTPYTDEYVLGLDQELLGGRLLLTWVKREGRDEFAREVVQLEKVLYDYKKDEYYDYLEDAFQLTNNGESHHDEYTLAWERGWQNHYLALNVTYQETEVSNDGYSEEFFDEDIYDVVWYDGSYLRRDELPREDFNRPWVANLIYAVRLPLNITFTNVTRYRSGYEGLEPLDDEEIADLELLTEYAYKKDKKQDSWVFDWKFGMDLPIYHDQILTLTLEINNVFNKQVEVGDPTGQLKYTPYELGRQYWFGMAYQF